MHRNATADIRIFVIWEPVLPTDWSRPDASITSNVPDRRALHYWDPNRRLSALYGSSANAANLAATSTISFKMKDVIWDAALVYPPGARWGAHAERLVAPVYKYADSLLTGGVN
jgi:hypothetical protein